MKGRRVCWLVEAYNIQEGGNWFNDTRWWLFRDDFRPGYDIDIGWISANISFPIEIWWWWLLGWIENMMEGSPAPLPFTIIHIKSIYRFKCIYTWGDGYALLPLFLEAFDGLRFNRALIFFCFTYFFWRKCFLFNCFEDSCLWLMFWWEEVSASDFYW